MDSRNLAGERPCETGGYRPRSFSRDAYVPRRRFVFRRRNVRKPLLLAATVLAGLLALALVGWWAWSSLAAVVDEAPTSSGLSAEQGPSSTPVSEWRRGEVPCLYQADPAWAGKPYAGGTIAENGCGPTCLAMAYVCLTGSTDYDPAALCAFAEQGGYVDGSDTSWLLMSDGARQLGLSSEQLPVSADAVRSALAAGEPVICSMGPGDFTTAGHFIVLAGLDDSGNVIVRDPNSAERTARSWDVDTLLSQCRNLWALSAA